MASNGLLRPVNNEEQEMVLNALLNDDSVDLEETLVSNGSESVKRKSMITLRPKTWLNDEIISYYLKVALKKEMISFANKTVTGNGTIFITRILCKTCWMNTTTLIQLVGEYTTMQRCQHGAGSAMEETFSNSNTSLSQSILNTYIGHWLSYTWKKKICWYDSLRGTDEVRLKALLQYLKDEHRNIHKEELEDKNEWKLIGCSATCPQQENSESNITIDHITTFS